MISGKTENIPSTFLKLLQTALQFVATLVIPSVVYRRQVAKLWCFQFSVLEIPVRSSLASNPSHFSFAFCASIRVQVSVEKSVVKCADFLNLCFVLLGFCFCLHTQKLWNAPPRRFDAVRGFSNLVWLGGLPPSRKAAKVARSRRQCPQCRDIGRDWKRRIEESKNQPVFQHDFKPSSRKLDLGSGSLAEWSSRTTFSCMRFGTPEPRNCHTGRT